VISEFIPGLRFSFYLENFGEKINFPQLIFGMGNQMWGQSLAPRPVSARRNPNAAYYG
jgi:hypothetical protein